MSKQTIIDTSAKNQVSSPLLQLIAPCRTTCPPRTAVTCPTGLSRNQPTRSRKSLKLLLRSSLKSKSPQTLRQKRSKTLSSSYAANWKTWMTNFWISTWCLEHSRINTTPTCTIASMPRFTRSKLPSPRSLLPTRQKSRPRQRLKTRQHLLLKSSQITRQKSLWTVVWGGLEPKSHLRLLSGQLWPWSKRASGPRLKTLLQLKALKTLSSFSMFLVLILLSGVRPSSSNARSRASASNSKRRKRSLEPSARLCSICAHSRTTIVTPSELKNAIKNIFDLKRPGLPVGRRTSSLFASFRRHWPGSLLKITAQNITDFGFSRPFYL